MGLNTSRFNGDEDKVKFAFKKYEIM
jgi:Ca2+-binding EF-hand superfamily protein